MALQKDIEFDNGIILEDAYIKVISVVFDYVEPFTASIRVNIYKNITAYAIGKPEVEKLEYRCVDPEYTTYFGNDKFENKDPQALAYEYLKTMDFYSGAVSL